MRAPVLIAAFVLCRVAMPVAMQAEQAKGVPQIGYLPPCSVPITIRQKTP
jgi:hypothetical protein